MKNIVAASLIAVAVVMPAQAQETVKPTDAPGAVEFLATQKSGEIRVRQWIGAPLKSVSGETVGDINDFLISDGEVTGVIAGVGGFLGIGEKDVAMPLSAVDLQSNQDGERVAMVDVTKADLKEAPAFKATGDMTWEQRKDKLSKDAKSAYEKAKDSVAKGYEATKEAAKKSYEDAKKAMDSNSSEPANQQQ